MSESYIWKAFIGDWSLDEFIEYHRKRCARNPNKSMRDHLDIIVQSVYYDLDVWWTEPEYRARLRELYPDPDKVQELLYDYVGLDTSTRRSFWVKPCPCDFSYPTLFNAGETGFYYVCTECGDKTIPARTPAIAANFWNSGLDEKYIEEQLWERAGGDSQLFEKLKDEYLQLLK